jgi:hypothetical protein
VRSAWRGANRCLLTHKKGTLTNQRLGASFGLMSLGTFRSKAK